MALYVNARLTDEGLLGAPELLQPPHQFVRLHAILAPCSWTPEESEVESHEHQDNANVHCQPFPEPVPEEHEIYTDYDGCHRHHVKHASYLSSHFSSYLPAQYFMGDGAGLNGAILLTTGYTIPPAFSRPETCQWIGISMELTITLQADSLSAEALQRVTSDLCRTLNREADVQAALVEKPSEPGARGGEQLFHIISMVIPVIHHSGNVLAHNIPDAKDVFTHASGIVLGESFLRILKAYFERHPTLKATLQNAKGSEVVIGSEDLEPDHVQQTANKVNATLSEWS